MKYIVLFENFELLEMTSATGVIPSGGSMLGHPNGLAGQTIGTNWASKTDAGPKQLTAGYNPGGTNRMQQEIDITTPTRKSREHGNITAKKKTNKLDLKALRAAFNKKQSEDDGDDEPKTPGEKKVMSFDDFEKSDINTIKR